MVVHAFNQRTQEVEAGGLGVWDQPGLQECVKKNGGGAGEIIWFGKCLAQDLSLDFQNTWPASLAELVTAKLFCFKQNMKSRYTHLIPTSRCTPISKCTQNTHKPTCLLPPGAPPLTSTHRTHTKLTEEQVHTEYTQTHLESKWMKSNFGTSS